jgi:lipoate---protein ligase
MFCIISNSTDPFFNLAADEYLLKNSREDYLVLGINDRCAVIGKHQAAHRETDTRFIHENNIPVVRRISGGGTVFHDRGNLNFSFILNSEEGKQVNFRKYTEPVIRFLASIGVEAVFEGKNDLRVNGFKISGNSEHVYHDRVLHHGTLLYDADLNMLRDSVRRSTGRYQTKAVGSNPSAVMNLKVVLKGHLSDRPDIYVFRSMMMEWFLENILVAEIGTLPADATENIKKLAVTKYRSWEWNYAYGPDYYFVNRFLFMGEECSCKLFVKEGIIREFEISGPEKLVAAGKHIPGRRHMVDDLKKIFEDNGLINSGFDIFSLF